MSRSCTAMSLKMPPPPRTYSTGGGEGSLDVSFTWTTSVKATTQSAYGGAGERGVEVGHSKTNVNEGLGG